MTGIIEVKERAALLVVQRVVALIAVLEGVEDRDLSGQDIEMIAQAAQVTEPDTILMIPARIQALVSEVVVIHEEVVEEEEVVAQYHCHRSEWMSEQWLKGWKLNQFINRNLTEMKAKVLN